MPTPPAVATIAGFKTQFDRDFIYGKGKDAVRDTDIQRGLNEAAALFNAALWDSQELPIAYYYATAHFMVLDIQAAGGLSSLPQGLGTENRNTGVISSKSVGQLSLQYGIPQSLIENPVLGQFMETSYGRRYLQIMAPRLIAGAITVSGPRDPGAAIPNLPFLGP